MKFNFKGIFAALTVIIGTNAIRLGKKPLFTTKAEEEAFVKRIEQDVKDRAATE